jgi:hypothetical protein
MKKIFSVVILAVFIFASSSLMFTKTAIADMPQISNAYAYSKERNIYIAWSFQAPAAEGYIDIYEYFSTGWVNIRSVPYNSQPVLLTDQSFGKHTYKLRAKIQISTSPVSYQYSDFTDPFVTYVLNTPTNLSVTVNPDTATSNGSSDLTLKWYPVDNNANTIYIYRQVSGTYVPEIIGKISSSKSSWEDSTDQPDTSYIYRISAVREKSDIPEVDQSALSAPVVTLSLPEPPMTFSAFAVDKNIFMSWTHSGNCIGYKIYQLEQNDTSSVWSLIAIIQRDKFSYSYMIPKYGSYSFKVTAYNSNGDSPGSPLKTVYVLEPPTGLKAEPLSANSINLSWNPVDENASGIVVLFSKTWSSYTVLETLPPSTTSLKKTNLDPETQYWFKLKLNNGKNESKNTEAVATKTLPATYVVPKSPSNLNATATSTSEIKLTWTDSSDNELGFTLQRKTENGDYSTIATLTENVTSYTDTGLTANTSYYYKIRAFNNFGTSDYSNEVMAKTLSPPPPPPPPPPQKTIIKLYIDKTDYYVNDELKTMDASPIIKESRTLLPIRYVAEALGATVQWAAIERKVTIILKDTVIELWIDKNIARVNGNYQLIDPTNLKVLPIIIPPGRTMLPIRFIAENLGCKVDWDATLREVTITSPVN